MNKTVFEKKLDERTNRARLAGAMQGYTPVQGAKIIPFPGATIDQGAHFQNGLEDFLREMGYIE